MEFRKVTPLGGPNLWAASPMLEVWLGPEHHANRLARDFTGFCERWATWLPLMPDPAARDKPDELLAGVRQGFTIAEALLRLTLRLERIACGLAQPALGFAAPADGYVRIAIEFEDEALARLSLACAWRMVATAIAGDPFDAQDEVTRLHLYADDYCLGPSTRAILAAAQRRRIPTRRLNQGSLVQLGSGAHQRRILTAETDRTSAIAEGIAQDKELTKQLLAAVGAPAPRGRTVASPADAWAAACEVGLPVVVKPRNANHGRGVSLNLSTRSQVETAFAHAQTEGDGVLVEQFARGAEHRLLVVEGRVVAATRGEPEQVEGDGRHTIAELVNILNTDPRRGRHYAFALNHVDLDPAALLTLEQQGYHPSSVPPAGATVVIHRNGEMTTDETDEVHPQVAAMAVLAADAVGLDIAGIDMLAPDISRPLEEQGGVILEVNAGPGLFMHLEPLQGLPRPVGEIIVESMFPPGRPGRVPMVAIAGCEDAPLVALVALILQSAGYFVGEATPRGAAANSRPLAPAQAPLWRRVDELSTHPYLTAMVVEFDAQTLEGEGMPLEHCDVAIIGPAFRAAGGAGAAFRTAETPGPGGSGPLAAAGPSGELDAVRRVIAGVILPEGWTILWLDDPLSVATAAVAGAPAIWLADDGNDSRLEALLARGDRAVFGHEGSILFAEGDRRWPLSVESNRLEQVAIRVGRRAILAAVAAGWALGIAEEAIAGGIRARHDERPAASGAHGHVPGELHPLYPAAGLSSGA